MPAILVLGASGTVGSNLSRLLADGGHAVLQATSRPPERPGQVPVDLTRGSGLDEAFARADRAFLLAPPGHVNQHELLGPAIDAARRHGLERVVLMSAMGADADPTAPLRRAELALEQSGLPWNVIRPNWFMQNFQSYWLHDILAHGRIRLPVGHARGSFVDARDIAAVAAALLTRDDLAGTAFDLTGPSALDHDEVAAIIARETGRDIGFEDITPEAMLEGLLGAGLPPDYARFMVMILGFFKAGYSERTTDAVRSITGRAPRTFEDYVREHRNAWLG
jgi:uncharacterized protein YbjT (DUF2867 family)